MPESKLLLCQEGASNKFWSYEIQGGNSVLVKWGRVGLDGESQVQRFNNPDDMRNFIDKKMREKQKKGYKESNRDQLKEEVKTAKELGHQHKIQRIQWVDKKGTTLRFISQYDPKRFVYVEILNSWSKEVVRLVLNKEEAFAIQGVAEANRTIEFDSTTYAPGDFVSGVRGYLRRISEKVAKVVVKFASLGVRKLSLGDDDEEDTETAQTVNDIYAGLGEASISRQAVSKFACLGNRCLDL